VPELEAASASAYGRPMAGSALTEGVAAGYVRVALDNVVTEYPNATQHVMAGPGEDVEPRTIHPVFYGSFDWHSCVHMHWLIVRLLRTFPDLAGAAEAWTVLERHLSSGGAAAEATYLASRPTFERPYGWGWALRLAGELTTCQDERAAGLAAALRPVAETVESLFVGWLAVATYPVRSGVHANSAFACALALDYARACDRPRLAGALEEAALRWFGDDTDYPAGWEPSGEDFLSPALVEAQLMLRVLDAERFQRWLDRFLPGLGDGAPATLFTPATVSDRSDYRIVHLDGLNLSRAWCWRSIAAALPSRDARRDRAAATAQAHLDAALPYVATGQYGGDHWLATFAVLALTG
jgi:hypothetical protein